MSIVPVRVAAFCLLVVTLAALAFAGSRPPASAEPGAPVAGARDAAAVERVVLVGVPGLSWSQINDATPTLLQLTGEATSGSVVIEHRADAPCPTEAWLGLGAVAAVPGRADVALAEGESATYSASSGCAEDAQPALDQNDDTVTLADFDGWQSAWADPPRRVSLGSLATGLRAEEQCVAAYGPMAALAASDRDGVLGRFDPSRLEDLNLKRIITGKNACPVTLFDASGMDPGALDERVGRLRDLLVPNSLLIVAGMPGGQPSTDAAVESLRPIVMLRTDDEGGASDMPRQLWSASTRTPGVIGWTDLGATILANANVPVTANMDGRPLTARSAPETDLRQENRETWASITLADRAQTGFAITWAALLALALGAAAAWLVYAPPHRRSGGSSDQRARAPLSFVGLAIATLPVATLSASSLPWWRWGADLSTVDVATVGMFRPILALVLLTAVFGALIVVAAWGAYRLVGGHPLVPVAVVASLTTIVVGGDATGGGGLALRSVLGAHQVTSNRFYEMTSVSFGLFSTAVLVLAGCIASMLYRRGRHGGSSRGVGQRRWGGVLAVAALGLTATAIIGAPDWGGDNGGVPAMLVGTLLVAVATAGRRLSPSVLLLLAVIATAGLGVIAFADWLQPEASRGTPGKVIEAVLNGNAFAVLGVRLDRSAGVLLDRPWAWLIVALLAIAVYVVTVRRTVAGGRLLPIWDQHLMRATAGALLATWVVGWLLNDSGVAALAAGLTIAYGAGLSIAARGRRPAL